MREIVPIILSGILVLGSAISLPYRYHGITSTTQPKPHQQRRSLKLITDLFKWNDENSPVDKSKVTFDVTANKTGYNQGNCADGQFVCDPSAHPPICMSLSHWCDNVYDCPDKQDESSCDNIVFGCPENHVVCLSRSVCVPAEQRCDGFDDCGDGTDEQDCDDVSTPLTASTPPPCPSGRYKCHMGPCILLETYCDGIADCPHRDDEENCPQLDHKFNCPVSKFQCESTGVCIELGWQCDGMQDCSDGSDEKYCRGNVRLPDRDTYSYLHIVTCTSHQFKCTAGEVKCIARDKLCNDYDDCDDGSDEGEFCVACEHYGCQQRCIAGPLGPECQCDGGLQLGRDGRSCVDMDECASGVHDCDQICVNAEGSFHCACQPGFHLLADERTCQLEDELSGSFIVLLPQSMHVLPLHNQAGRISVHGLAKLGEPHMGRLIHADLIRSPDGDDHEMVLTAQRDNGNTGALYLAGRDGTRRLVDNIADIADVQIDHKTLNIYYTAQGGAAYAGVNVCTMDGRYCRLLVSDKRLSHVRGLALDIERAIMFWSGENEVGHPVINTAQMDGSSPSVLVDGKLSMPYALTIDSARQHLYWADADYKVIEALDLRSMKRELIVSSGVHSPSDIRVFGHRVYWTERGSNSLISDHVHATENSPAIIKSFREQPLAVMIDHPSADAQYPADTNPCINAKCGHICVLALDTYNDKKILPKCMCPNGYKYSKGIGQCQSNSANHSAFGPSMALEQWQALCAADMACVNGGHCIQLTTDQPKCSCPWGYAGTYCEVNLYPSNGADQESSLGVGSALLIVVTLIVVLIGAVVAYKRRHLLVSKTTGLKQHVVSVARYSRAGLGAGRQRNGSFRQTLLSKGSSNESAAPVGNETDVSATSEDSSFGNPLYSETYESQRKTTSVSLTEPLMHPKAPFYDNDSGISHSSVNGVYI